MKKTFRIVVMASILTLMLSSCININQRPNNSNYQGEPAEYPIFIMFTSPT